MRRNEITKRAPILYQLADKRVMQRQSGVKGRVNQRLTGYLGQNTALHNVSQIKKRVKPASLFPTLLLSLAP